MNSVLPPAGVEQQHGLRRQRRLRAGAGKGPACLLLAGDDLDRQTRSRANRVQQLGGVVRVTGGAGGDDARRWSAPFTRSRRKRRHRRGRLADGRGLELACLVETPPQPRLPAFFVQWRHRPASDLGDEQLDGIGADINDGPAKRMHAMRSKYPSHRPINSQWPATASP
jgi:hypothetical protein